MKDDRSRRREKIDQAADGPARENQDPRLPPAIFVWVVVFFFTFAESEAEVITAGPDVDFSRKLEDLFKLIVRIMTQTMMTVKPTWKNKLLKTVYSYQR